ncbi:acetyl-CoA carboxylase carboxyltransferase subunit alpha [Alkaliphilus oremlandii]|uniref:Acetyl-coenzyme A carboxylase carboxyl transferase subunit alpha n=1 Tax=Alkaliphilus oremlandii (strain OhILAs) TaxID=350688 RepID=ACCA_ALKOO|nr:acetyl-CoA carboxylase carboxyltransferase subunit alpha [Alkaliphilus oremlandii]A8MLP2.1 RecName: Full=Acetyl-coenzyme A carboxylase carboxyl transferase subunit alpha; Short=ACCase subunit alpha; Short=Acetyl-CoA carboxylase carboxyltransferase subunit alpha [Alkaliphilus oremlandii OhILAs]ABW17959.1 acetyl-CoA carboxylase, carboxyl transferase, alpha subunit [Alkaliphilus oremlandii OhILAs]
MHNFLESEKAIHELEGKIIELINFADKNKVDLTYEIEILSQKLEQMQKEMYENLNPWSKVKLARLQERPTTLDYIEKLISGFTEFHGDRFYGDDTAIVGGIGLFEGIPVTVIGHQKGKDTKDNIRRNFGMPHPEGYRKALRLMKQAEKFKRPILTFIDTSGAYCGIGAEERGQGEAIAVNLIEMSKLKTPIIAIVIGEGGSGGALALGIGDRVCMLEHSIYSVISPEGLSTILWKDATLAQRAADMMQLTAQDLWSMKVIDQVIKEPLGGAHKNADLVADQIKTYVLQELKDLRMLKTEELLEKRYTKIRNIGIWK